jgi:Alpha-L-fucosidase/Ricin-type beta-trefoil lectin domain-like
MTRPLKMVSSALVAALFATAVGLAIPSASPPAQAVDGISANWFESARYGIFSHYVPKLTIRSNGSLSASVDDAANNFNATQYAADVAAFGAQYVTFTVWHAGMQPLYPSAVMNSYRPGNSSQRDVIRDLINALAPYNIKLVLYIHPVDGFEFTGVDQAATGWGDSANGYKKWNDFVNAMVRELGNRYGTDVAGYWEDLAYDQTVMDKARLYTSMKAGNPSRVVIGNSGAGSVRNLPPTASTDYAALEYYEDAGPKPAGTWIAPLTNWKSDSNQNATITTGSWIADTPYGTSSSALMGKTATDIYRHTVMQAASNLHGGGMLWNVSPYIGLTGPLWEDGAKSTMTAVGDLIRAAGPSIAGVVPSGAYPVQMDKTIATLPNGIATVASANGNATFIHVLNPPTGSSLILPAPHDRRVFGSATLQNGKPVVVSQSASQVKLTLPAGESWSSIDTVITIKNTGRYQANVLNDDAGTITYSAAWSSSAARNVGDFKNDLHYTGQNGATASVSFTGTGISVITPTGPDYGNIQITVDGGSPTTVSAYSAAYKAQQSVYQIHSLSNAAHTVTISKQSGTYMQLDAVAIDTPSLPTGVNLHVTSQDGYANLQGTGNAYAGSNTARNVAGRTTPENPEMLWTITDAGNGYIKITNVTGLLLTGTSDGYQGRTDVMNVVEAPATNTDTQLWKPVLESWPYYRLNNKASGMSLWLTGNPYLGLANTYNVVQVPSSWSGPQLTWSIAP